ncbi:hypothetical protein Tco_0112782, partial [Tanacetum coccineum]
RQLPSQPVSKQAIVSQQAGPFLPVRDKHIEVSGIELRGGLSKSKEAGTQRYLSLVVPLKKVGDEAVHKEMGDRMERAATTASSFEVEHDSGNIN